MSKVEVEVVRIFKNVSLRSILSEGWREVKKWVDENKVGVMLVSVDKTGSSLGGKLICMKKIISGVEYKSGSVIVVVYYDMDLSKAYNNMCNEAVIENNKDIDYKVLDFNKLEFKTISCLR